MESDGQCWQSEIVEKSNMNSSKISRTLTNLEKKAELSQEFVMEWESGSLERGRIILNYVSWVLSD